MQVRVRFDAEQALSELHRLNLLEAEPPEQPLPRHAHRVVDSNTAYNNLKADW